MRSAIIAAFLLAGCGRDVDPVAPPAVTPDSAQSSRGDLQSSGPDSALAIRNAGGETAMRLFCPSGAGTLLVNVPAFKPIDSEERLSFGHGGEAVTLVANLSGDKALGGVTGEGPVPANLAALLSGRPSASYGAQTSGPHPRAPPALVNAFASACSDGPSGDGNRPPQPANPGRSAPAASPCLVQDGKAIPANIIRAVGTEPFWGARVEGRCVTYSHPDDQSGTRVWTRFSGTAANGRWTGSLNGRPFVMRTRPRAGCSDGMSDNRYPIAVTLRVGGEQRSGCAEPK